MHWRSISGVLRSSSAFPVLLDARSRRFKRNDRPLQPARTTRSSSTEPPTLEHLRLLFKETLFLRWLGNTAASPARCVVAITLLLAVPAAYALTRLTGRWGERARHRDLPDVPRPADAALHPALADRRGPRPPGLALWSIIVVYPSFTIPFSTWLLMGFFKSIPRELEDAAMVDGLTRFQALLQARDSDLGLGDPDRRDLHVHARDAGVRLRADVHLLGVAPDGRRRRADLSSCAATSTTGARSWPPA